MLQSGQNWDLFGYDVRQVFRHWRAAWREFLWGYDSPVKARLDEVLRVSTEQGVEYYHAGQRVASPEQALASGSSQVTQSCEAVLLPDAMVLSRQLKMPLAVESDLDMAMTLEVAANSPFPANDTGSGWRVISRDNNNITVQLAIVSLSATMAYLGQQYDSHDPKEREVWAGDANTVIVLSGFGEQKRLSRYNKRLIKVASTLGYCAVLLVVLFGAAAGVKYMQLEQLRSSSAEIQALASQAIQNRSDIVKANETIAAVNELMAQRPSPHYELARLSKLLGDDASLLQLSVHGTAMDVRGVADDAAVVVQQLTEEPAYAQVTAPQAITKYFNTGQEQFFLNILLAGASPLASQTPDENSSGAPRG